MACRSPSIALDIPPPCLRYALLRRPPCVMPMEAWLAQARLKERLQLALGRATSLPVDEVKLRQEARLAEAGSVVRDVSC